MTQENPPKATHIDPPAYLVQLCDWLKQNEPALWDWYSSNKTHGEQADAIRFDLLKSTYRISRDSRADMYELGEQAAQQLKLDTEITLYQAQSPSFLNAAIAHIPGEAHIVFDGAVDEALNEKEMLALFGHELSHSLLWEMSDGDFYTAAQMLAALTTDRRAEPVHFQTERLADLYKEIFCDQGSFLVVGDELVVVSTLVKMSTHVDRVDPASFVEQSHEIFANGHQGSKGVTHPEPFIRARALDLLARDDEHTDIKIAEMIEGPMILNQLDLIRQLQVKQMTRAVIDQMLSPSWMQTDTMIGHAQMFIDDYRKPKTENNSQWEPEQSFEQLDQTMVDYFCYLLLDFVTADRDLEEAPLAVALNLSSTIQIKDRFMEIARKELKLRKKQIEKIDQEKQSLIEAAEREFAKP